MGFTVRNLNILIEICYNVDKGIGKDFVYFLSKSGIVLLLRSPSISRKLEKGKKLKICRIIIQHDKPNLKILKTFPSKELRTFNILEQYSMANATDQKNIPSYDEYANKEDQFKI